MTKHFDRLYHVRNYDWERAMREGCKLAVENARKNATLSGVDVMWELLKDAISVSGITYTGTPRQGLPRKSAMPDAPDEITYWQQMSAYLRGETEDQPEIEARPPEPTAEQISRAGMVLEVWHRAALKERGDWKRIRKAVYLKASGVPHRKVSAITGFSRQRLHRSKAEAMGDMLEFIRTL